MKKLAITVLFVSFSFLVSCQEKQAKTTEEPTMKGKQKSPCAAKEFEKTSQSYPLGEVIRLEKSIPQQVNANAPFDYRIEVTNLTDNQLESVVVSDQIPEQIEFESSTPELQKTEGSIVWNLGTIEPKGTRTIVARAIAKSTGSLDTCANVSYDCPTCAEISVVQPKLSITRSAPSQILSCDRIPLHYIVQNTGDGYACDISVDEKLPQGLMTAQGDETISFGLDSLAPGESKEFDMMVDAMGPGKFSGKATVSARDIAAVDSDTIETVVNKPVLSLESRGPEKQYVGRPVTYEIIVKNTGDGIAANSVVVADIPEGVTFGNATEGGEYTHMSPGKVTWNIGELAPNSSKTLKLEVIPEQAGDFASTVTANARCAETVSHTGKTTITGIPAILLEVTDTPDPIVLGQDVMYIIKVTNQGSADNSNIKINCMLEEGMEFVTSSGPTEAQVEGNNINFQPLGTLSPKETVQWSVTVKAANEGDKRFKTSLTETQLDRPVEETEATTFYK
ncbi:MAG: Large cysteine-rich periplasmic protein OmcB precursor [Planctomycetes bacterium ADurb.Bin401]|nr:MAG: Large cysteine-rich periplasmic protein OmcB precursor [Planctomycetes bacterium ADurb.Bin401]